MLDDIALWMPRKPLDDLVARLNRSKTNRLPHMWELAWLYALGTVLPVEHERPLASGKPDVWFTAKAGEHSFPVIADITTVSDVARVSENPYDKLSEAMHRQARKAGIEGGGFHIAVSHVEAGAAGKKKVQLLIPTGPSFEQLVKRRLKPFAQAIAAGQNNPMRLEVDEPGAKFTITYNGPSQYSGGSHRAYDGILSLENNVLFNRLSDKTRQLRGAPAGAVRMIIVCDGDCAVLRRDHPMEGFSANKIAEHFLRGSKTIDLVLLVGVDEERRAFFFPRDRRFLRCSLIASPSGRPEHLTAEVVEAVRSTFEKAISKLPGISMMPNNALRRNLDSEWSGSMEGAYEQGGNRIKVSARAVLELLAGAMTYDRFAEVHRWTEGEFNMFKARLESGQIFTAAKIERLGPTQDDDWIEFEFGQQDPAISKFKVPVPNAEHLPDSA